MRLSQADRRRWVQMLAKEAEAFGFRGAVWTNPRLAKLIQRELGVRYHSAHVSRLLKELGWTLQKPLVQAKQRKPEEIERWWQERWPELKKKACEEGRNIVFIDESGFCLLPMVVRSYAPRGLTPILKEYLSRDPLGNIAGITPPTERHTDFTWNAFQAVLQN